MLSQLKHKGFFFYFVNRNPHMFPQKARHRNDWDNHDCDGYSNQTAVYVTMSADAFFNQH